LLKTNSTLSKRSKQTSLFSSQKDTNLFRTFILSLYRSIDTSLTSTDTLLHNACAVLYFSVCVFSGHLEFFNVDIEWEESFCTSAEMQACNKHSACMLNQPRLFQETYQILFHYEILLINTLRFIIIINGNFNRCTYKNQDTCIYAKAWNMCYCFWSCTKLSFIWKKGISYILLLNIRNITCQNSVNFAHRVCGTF